LKGGAGRHLRDWAVLALLLLLGLTAALRGAWFEPANQWLYDTAIAASGRPPASDILIVAIDEASLGRLGRWPWSRTQLAAMLDRLRNAGAGPLLLDIILSEPEQDGGSADARLAQAIAAYGRVVMPVFIPAAGGMPVLPLPMFARAARLGHAQALVDRDGVSRRYMPQEESQAGQFAHVSAVLLEVAGQASDAATPAGPRLLPFAGPAGHYPRVSAADLLAGVVATDQLRGKTILLGATATGLGDNLVTPLAGVNGAMPGVEFVANSLDALASGRQLRVVPPALQTGTALLLVLGLLLLLLLTSPRIALVTTLAFFVATLLLAGWLVARWGWWWPPAAPLAVMALAYPLWSWRRLESSLNTMTRETVRIAALTRPGAAAVLSSVGYLDPVETRIAAISGAVDRIADSMALESGTSESRQQRDDMMRHLAHDLRSPLVSLRALAAQFGSGNNAEQAAMLQRIDVCARRSLDLTEQFLLLGRAQALDAQEFGEVDLVQLLHQCADDLYEDAQRSGTRIARRCKLDIALVRGDLRLLQRALLNLGWNALRHGPPGGVVTLSLDAIADEFLLQVHDQGHGFAPEALRRLSQPHTQGAGRATGHGLGLALVQLVAKKHQARLSVLHPESGGFSIAMQLIYSSTRP